MTSKRKPQRSRRTSRLWPSPTQALTGSTKSTSMEAYCQYLVEPEPILDKVNVFIASDLPVTPDELKHADYSLMANRRKILTELFDTANLRLYDRLMVYMFSTLHYDKVKLKQLLARLSSQIWETTVSRAIDFIRGNCLFMESSADSFVLPLKLIACAEPAIAALCWRDTRKLGERKLDEFLRLPFTQMLAIDPMYQVGGASHQSVNYEKGVFADGYRTKSSQLHHLCDFDADSVLQPVYPSAGLFALYTKSDLLFWLNARRPYRVLAGKKSSSTNESGSGGPLLACNLPQW